MLNTTKTTLNSIGGDLLNPPITQWSTTEIAERVKQLRLLQLAETELVRSRAMSWVFTVLVCVLGVALLLAVLGIIGRVVFLDWVLAGCR